MISQKFRITPSQIDFECRTCQFAVGRDHPLDFSQHPVQEVIAAAKNIAFVEVHCVFVE